MRRLLSKLIKEDNFLSLSGNLVIAVFGFAGFAILARSLNPNDFAQWVLFISGASLVDMLRYGITNNGLVRFLPGADEKYKRALIGANVLLSFLVTLIIVLVLSGIKFFFNEYISGTAYNLFFKWFPILALLNLPFNNALVLHHAKMKYGNILFIRAINSSLFFMFLILNYLIIDLGINELVIVFLAVNAISSLFCVFRSWDGIKMINKANHMAIKTLLNFGKYSSFTLIGTNLLRNADIIIISISPFGSAAVALFSIPLKLTELQQIPLRSFAATAFPKMSKASIEGNLDGLKKLFNIYSGALTYLFAAVSLVSFVFAKEFVIIISGYQYLDVELIGIDIVFIVKVLSIYGLLLPADRMTGIGLDSINKPNINAFKVLIMLGTNIIGDLIAIYVFESIEMVAISTLLFTAVGIGIGIYHLNRQVQLSFTQIYKNTNSFYKNLLQKSFLIQRASTPKN